MDLKKKKKLVNSFWTNIWPLKENYSLHYEKLHPLNFPVASGASYHDLF